MLFPCSPTCWPTGSNFIEEDGGITDRIEQPEIHQASSSCRPHAVVAYCGEAEAIPPRDYGSDAAWHETGRAHRMTSIKDGRSLRLAWTLLIMGCGASVMDGRGSDDVKAT